MKMLHAIQQNVTEGATQVKQTGVGGDAKIVYAILSGMIADKVVYPVREYATNAWEVSPAGRPPEINLPTRFDLRFNIRDFGPGLSHSFMMNRYAKIGDSTKDGDDQAVGGWGFGSKAALAYLMRSDGAGAFTVTSRHKGFRRVYVIGVSEVGKIEIRFMGEWPLEADDRGTGLEIEFPVRVDDVQRFRDHAKAVYWSFEPRPVLTPAIDFGTPKVLHSGDGWTLYRDETVPFDGPQVQIGPVCYPIDMSLAPDDASQLITYKTPIVFKAPIGSVSVSTSRENLQYDDRTEAALRAMFKHYDEDWLVKARALIDAETTYFDAIWRARDIASAVAGANGWWMVNSIGWKGFKFGDSLFQNDVNGVKAARWPEARSNVNGMGILSFKQEFKINPAELAGRTVVIQHNTSRTSERWQASGLTYTKCLWVRCKRQHLAYALAEMGNPEYVLLDSFELPKLAPRPKAEKRPESEKKLKLMALDGSTYRDWVDIDDELFVIELVGRGRRSSVRFMLDGKERHFSLEDFQRYMKWAIELDLLDRELRMVVVDEGNLAVAPDHWQSVGDLLAEAIDAKLDATQVAPTIDWSLYDLPANLRTFRERIAHQSGTLPPALADILDEVKRLLAERETHVRDAKNEHDNMASINLWLTGTDVKSVVKDPTEPVITAWEAFEAAHPLFVALMDNLTSHRGSSSYYRDVQERAEGAFKHYFALLANA